MQLIIAISLILMLNSIISFYDVLFVSVLALLFDVWYKILIFKVREDRKEKENERYNANNDFKF